MFIKPTRYRSWFNFHKTLFPSSNLYVVVLPRGLPSLDGKLERFVTKSGKSDCQTRVRQTIPTHKPTTDPNTCVHPETKRITSEGLEQGPKQYQSYIQPQTNRITCEVSPKHPKTFQGINFHPKTKQNTQELLYTLK